MFLCSPGLATISLNGTTVTIDTRHQTIIAITEIGIEVIEAIEVVIDPTRISEGEWSLKLFREEGIRLKENLFSFLSVDTRPPRRIP